MLGLVFPIFPLLLMYFKLFFFFFWPFFSSLPGETSLALFLSLFHLFDPLLCKYLPLCFSPPSVSPCQPSSRLLPPRDLALLFLPSIPPFLGFRSMPSPSALAHRPRKPPPPPPPPYSFFRESSPWTRVHYPAKAVPLPPALCAPLPAEYASSPRPTCRACLGQ